MVQRIVMIGIVLLSLISGVIGENNVDSTLELLDSNGKSFGNYVVVLPDDYSESIQVIEDNAWIFEPSEGVGFIVADSRHFTDETEFIALLLQQSFPNSEYQENNLYYTPVTANYWAETDAGKVIYLIGEFNSGNFISAYKEYDDVSSALRDHESLRSIVQEAEMLDSLPQQINSPAESTPSPTTTVSPNLHPTLDFTDHIEGGGSQN